MVERAPSAANEMGVSRKFTYFLEQLYVNLMVEDIDFSDVKLLLCSKKCLSDSSDWFQMKNTSSMNLSQMTGSIFYLVLYVWSKSSSNFAMKRFAKLMCPW